MTLIESLLYLLILIINKKNLINLIGGVFANENIIETVHDILNIGNGADKQIKCFEKFGFEGLKKQLIEEDRK